jgi:hypothetical protein
VPHPFSVFQEKGAGLDPPSTITLHIERTPRESLFNPRVLSHLYAFVIPTEATLPFLRSYFARRVAQRRDRGEISTHRKSSEINWTSAGCRIPFPSFRKRVRV